MDYDKRIYQGTIICLLADQNRITIIHNVVKLLCAAGFHSYEVSISGLSHYTLCIYKNFTKSVFNKLRPTRHI